MSFSREEEDPARDIFYVNFNQSSTSLCVGARSGFNVYDLETVYECRPTFESREDPEYRPKDPAKYHEGPLLKDVCIIEKNFQTALSAYVKLEKPRCVFLFNLKFGVLITHRAFPNTVLSVKLNRHNTVVCLEDRIFILVNLALLEEDVHIITDTPINLKGLIALTYAQDHNTSLVAYPGSSAHGHVQIFDAYNKHAKIMIPAHASQLAALAFNEEATKLATASVRGTVIRVFCVATGDKLFEFQRGLKRCADIHCLSFCKNPELLLASSNTETIHIFKLCAAETIEPVRDEAEGWMEMFGRVLYTQSTQYLPTQMTDVLNKPRSFAYIHLPFVDQKTVCAITYIKKVPYVMVASLEGYLYIYDINMETGGPCHLVKQHRIEGPCQAGNLSWINTLNSPPEQRRTREEGSDDGADPTACLKSQTTNIKPQEENGSPPLLSCPTEELLPELCIVNGIKTTTEELPPLMTEVEQ